MVWCFWGKSQTWTGTVGFGLVQTGSQLVQDRTSPTLPNGSLTESYTILTDTCPSMLTCSHPTHAYPCTMAFPKPPTTVQTHPYVFLCVQPLSMHPSMHPSPTPTCIHVVYNFYSTRLVTTGLDQRHIKYPLPCCFLVLEHILLCLPLHAWVEILHHNPPLLALLMLVLP